MGTSRVSGALVTFWVRTILVVNKQFDFFGGNPLRKFEWAITSVFDTKLQTAKQKKAAEMEPMKAPSSGRLNHGVWRGTLLGESLLFEGMPEPWHSD